MVTRRTVLLGTSVLALGAVTGCSGAAAPDGAASGAASPTGSGTTSPSGARPQPSSRAAATASPGPAADATPEVPRHPRPELDETLADGLDVPWGIAFLRSGAAVVGERGTGRLLHVSPTGRPRTLGEVAGVVAPSGLGEGGLLGLALAPGDEETLFAHFTSGSDNRVVRLSMAGGRVGRWSLPV